MITNIKNTNVGKYMQPVKVCIPKQTKVWNAWRIMKNENCKYLFIEENQNIIGIVSFYDLQIVSSLPGNERTEVFELMDTNLITVDAGEDVLMAIERLRDTHKHYVQVQQNGKIVGLFSCFEAMNALYEVLSNSQVPVAN